MAGDDVRIDEESGRHFIGPVPAERECSSRVFRRVATSHDSDPAATFQCLRCRRRRFLAPWQIPSKSARRADPITASHGQRHRFNLFDQ